MAALQLVLHCYLAFQVMQAVGHLISHLQTTALNREGVATVNLVQAVVAQMLTHHQGLDLDTVLEAGVMLPVQQQVQALPGLMVALE